MCAASTYILREYIIMNIVFQYSIPNTRKYYCKLQIVAGMIASTIEFEKNLRF